MIRQRNIDKESMVGLILMQAPILVAASGNVISAAPLVLADVEKVEVLELGGAVDGTFTGTNLVPTLTKLADDDLEDTGTVVKAISAANDIDASGEYCLEKYDPPGEVTPDYTNASAQLSSSGFAASGGVVKLALQAKGTFTVAKGGMWALLRVTKRGER